MEEDFILYLISDYAKNVNWDFPEERLGPGDKLLLEKTVRKQYYSFSDTGAGWQNAGFAQAVRTEMKKYGFKPREMRT